MSKTKDFAVNVGDAEYSTRATTRRTAVASVMLEMLRSGKIRLLDFDAERVSTWTVTEVPVMRTDKLTRFYDLPERLIGWIFLAGWFLTIICHCGM